MAAPAPDILSTWAASQPGATAVVEGDRSLTFVELEAEANRIAAVLLDLGLEPGDTVAWCGQNGVEVVAVVNATRKAGAVSVPLNYRLTPDEAAYVIDDADAVIVLFDVEQAEQLATCPTRCPSVRKWVAFRTGAADVPSWAEHLEGLTAHAPDGPVAPREGRAGGSMIYTSGTTGKPKGALRRGGTDPDTAGALVQLIGYEVGDVYLTTGPLYHSGPLGFMGIVQGMGGSVVLQRHFDAEGWLALVDRHRVTTTFSAPTPIRRVVDLPEEVRSRYDYSSMRRMVANAAPWPFALKRRYVDAFGDTSLWEVYGSTELGVNTVLRPEDQMRKPGSCGRPAPLVDVALFDVDGAEVTANDEPGELFVRSRSAFDTYHKAVEKFEASKRGDWLTVGDIAYRDDEGFFYICDRKGDMVISGGMNVYPAEIEAVLVAHPSVADAAVFGVPSEEWGEVVHAVVTTREPVTNEAMTAFCREHLASYKLPRGYTRMEEIPRSASGKILKKDLRAQVAIPAASSGPAPVSGSSSQGDTSG